MSPVPCPSCGTRNRVPVVATGTPACASCHAPLPWVVEADAATFDDSLTGRVPVIVDLWAPWCGPCRVLSPVLEDLARQRAGRLKVVKVNVDDHPSISERYGVQGIPTLLLAVDGRIVSRQVGAAPAHALVAWLDAATAG